MGHVANSSSSSFILHKAEIGDAKFDELVDFLKKVDEQERLDEENSYYWGDSYKKFELHGNYLNVELFHAPEEVINKFNELVPNAEELCFVIQG